MYNKHNDKRSKLTEIVFSSFKQHPLSWNAVAAATGVGTVSPIYLLASKWAIADRHPLFWTYRIYLHHRACCVDCPRRKRALGITGRMNWRTTEEHWWHRPSLWLHSCAGRFSRLSCSTNRLPTPKDTGNRSSEENWALPPV